MSRPLYRKALGQHHLRQGELCREAVAFLRPAGQTVIEIGAGDGVLTRELLAAGARVLAWELDLDWAASLRRRERAEALTVIVADALRLEWGRLPETAVVCGNLPYNVATPIIRGFLLAARAVDRAAFLVQAEVGERLAATPGTKSYGYLSVVAQLLARVSILRRVAAGSFHPAPRVDGVFVGLERRSVSLPVERRDSVLALASLAFAHRRKTLRRTLQSRYDRGRLDAALAAAGVDGRRRAETLQVEELLRLHDHLSG